MLTVKLEKAINKISDVFGSISAVLMILLLLNVFYDVVMRYLFNDVSIGMQEMEWHLYAAIFLLGIPYTLKEDGHVRVDLIYERLSANKQAWVNIFGAVVFLLPFTVLVAYYGIEFAYDSFTLNERSGDPGGLHYRWVIKSMISFSFFVITLSGIGMILKAVNTLRGFHHDKTNSSPLV